MTESAIRLARGPSGCCRAALCVMAATAIAGCAAPAAPLPAEPPGTPAVANAGRLAASRATLRRPGADSAAAAMMRAAGLTPPFGRTFVLGAPDRRLAAAFISGGAPRHRDSLVAAVGVGVDGAAALLEAARMLAARSAFVSGPPRTILVAIPFSGAPATPMTDAPAAIGRVLGAPLWDPRAVHSVVVVGESASAAASAAEERELSFVAVEPISGDLSELTLAAYEALVAAARPARPPIVSTPDTTGQAPRSRVTIAWLTDTVTSDLDRAVRYTLLWGLDGVVLRTVGGADDRVPHVNESRLRRRLEEADLPVAAIDPGLFEAPAAARTAWLNDLAAFDETASFCQRVGCRVVIVGALAGETGGDWDARASAEVLARAATRAAAAGVQLAVRNATETACRDGEALAEVLGRARGACESEAARGALGAAWHPADAVRAGAGAADGLDALQRAGVPLSYVAVRDGHVDADGWLDAIPGAGAVGWAGHLAALSRGGFDGTLGLAVHGRPTGTFGLRAASALIGLVRAAPAPS